MSHANSGMNKTQVYNLAYELDKNKTGFVDYTNIIDQLENLKRNDNIRGVLESHSYWDDDTHNKSELDGAESASRNFSNFTNTQNNVSDYNNECMNRNRDDVRVDASSIHTMHDELSQSQSYSVARRSPPKPARLISQVYGSLPSDGNWVRTLAGGTACNEARIVSRAVFNRESEGPVAVGSALQQHRISSDHMPKQATQSLLEASQESFSQDNGSIQGSAQTDNQLVDRSSLQSFIMKYRSRGQPTAADSASLKETSTMQPSSISSASRNSSQPLVPTNIITSNITERNVLSQLGGRVGTLRHYLKAKDQTRSGYVNFEEFRVAQQKAGVALPRQAAESHFQRHSSRGGNTGEGAALLDIDAYVHTLQREAESLQAASALDRNPNPNAHPIPASTATLSSTQSQHVRVTGDRQYSSGVDQETRRLSGVDQETRRLAKKAVSALSDLSRNPARVYQEIGDRRIDGHVPRATLKEGLNRLGAGLSDLEFDLLLDRMEARDPGLSGGLSGGSTLTNEQIPSRKDTEISLVRLENALQHTVNKAEEEDANNRANRYEREGVSRTLRSDRTLSHHSQTMYDVMTNSKPYRAQSLKWSKLKAVLQENHDKIKGAFVADQSGGRDSVPTDAVTLPVDELCPRLRTVGLDLGPEDTQLLQRHAGRTGSTVSLATLCDVVGIDVVTNVKGEKGLSVTLFLTQNVPSTYIALVLQHPLDKVLEGGIFCNASAPRQPGRPYRSHNTTIFENKKDDVLRSQSCSGTRKR